MKAWLSPSMQRDLTAVLEGERDRVRSTLRSLVETERTLGASQAEEGAVLGQPADVASDLAVEEFDLGLEEATCARLAEIEAALQRMTEGRYGVCEHCGDDMAEERLQVLPWARLCLKCATRHA